MPVIELSRGLGRAGSRHDYSLRLDSDRRDEIGVLFAGFNRLMSRIERSQKDLQDYRYALDQSAMVCVVDISGLVRRVNNRFEMATGYNGADIIDRPITLLNEQLSLDNFNSTVNDSYDGRKYDLGELLCHTPNNDELWMTIT